jgi:hypothetical protein
MFGLIIVFFEHVQIVTMANSHTLQLTAARTESSQSALSSLMSSASMSTFTTNFLLFWLPSQDSALPNSYSPDTQAGGRRTPISYSSPLNYITKTLS